MILVRRDGAPLDFMSSLRGFLARVLSGWMGGRPRSGPEAWKAMRCLPDAASHTSWAVRGIKMPPEWAGTPDERQPLR